MAENRRILIVDHEQRAAVDMARVLRSAGYEVLEAPTGKECLLLAREGQPHLILVDEALSDISGIDLLKQIKRDNELSRAYVAVLSRDGTAPAIQARALESGADALIPRTSQTREFLARIEALLRRQAAEQILRTSLQEHRATFDAMSDAVYLVNMDYIITDCNLAMARFLARPRGEIVGGRCFELVHGTAKPIPACLGQRVRDTRRRESLVVPMEERWLQVDVDPLLDASGAVIGSVHVLRDITEQRRTEEALQQAQAELEMRAAEHHLALDKANKDLQAEVDARVQAQDVLKRAQADLELRGREVDDLTQTRLGVEANLQRLQRELRAVAGQASDLVYTWEVESGRAHLVSDAQSRFAGEGSAFPATVGELQQMIHPQDRTRVVETVAQNLSKGAPWSAEYRVVHHDGQVAHWAVSAAPLGEAPSEEWMAVVRDVTVQRRAEQDKETLTAQLHQAQKMDALRRLAAGVANEFNRLLAAIVGQIELLLARIEPAHPLYGDLQAIAKAARQGVALIQRLLAFAGREALQPEMLDVNLILEELKPKLQRALGQGVELQLALAPQLRPVLADAAVLQDIVLSMAARAAAAIPQGGVLRVHTADVTLTEAYARTRPLARVGNYVRMTIACDGAALPEEALEGIFELQLAAPETEAGAELGLGVVYGLVQQLGGFIEAAQTATGGTTWEVYLPAYPGEGGEEGPAGGEEAGEAEVEEPPSACAPEVAAPEPLAAESPATAAHVVASEDMEALPQPSAPEPPSTAPGEAEMSSAAAEGVVTPAGPAQEHAADLSEQPTAGTGEAVGAPATEAPVMDEGVEGAPASGEGAAAEPGAQVPDWLVEPSDEADITAPTPPAPETPPEAVGDITDEEPSGSHPSPLSGLRSRLRRLGRRN